MPRNNVKNSKPTGKYRVIKILSYILFLSGFTSIISQVVIFRELAIVFSGNELFIGLTLAIWLLSASIGSYIFRVFNSKMVFYYVISLQGLLPIIIVLAIRAAKNVLVGYGEAVGLIEMIYTILIFITPLSFCTGAVFSLAGNLVEDNRSITLLYFCETLGSVIGGSLFTFLLAGKFLNITLVFISFAGMLIGMFLLKRSVLSFFLLALCIILGSFSGPINITSRSWEWKRYGLVEDAESRYGHIAITRTGSIYSLYKNGFISTSWPNKSSVEDVHFAMLACEYPEKVLLIGNGYTEISSEVLKYRSVKKIDYPELDRKAVELIRKHNSKDTKDIVNYFYIDGRRWIKNLNYKYDVIILFLPPPANLEINRFYTLEFFREVKNKLLKNGIFYLSLPSSENYLTDTMKIFNGSIYKTLKKVFLHIRIIPGETMILLASQRKIELNIDKLTRKLKAYGIKNHYVNEYLIPFRLNKSKVKKAIRNLESIKHITLNSDYHPISYYYYFKIWLSQFYRTSYLFYILIFLVLIFYFIRKLWNNKTCISLSVISFSGITLEVMLILNFQAIYGYIYNKIGLLFALFMLGLSIGSMLGKIAKIRKLSLPFLLMIVLVALTAFCRLPEILFYGFLFADGLIIGFSFSMLCFLSKGDKYWSILYGADLFGSFIGALLTGTIFIPLLGIRGTAFLILGVVMTYLVIFKPGLKKSGRLFNDNLQ